MGQMAQSTGDYFVLLGRYEEARGEYQSALTTYEQVLSDSADFGEAQSNKQTVLKSLGELQDKLEEEFLIGQMAQATGEYFALLKRYDEARGEYLAAISYYEKITPSFPNFLQAQTNKDNISVLLESLQLESSVNQRQVEEDEDISGVTKAIDNSTAHNISEKESRKSIQINFYAFHLLKDPITQQEIPGAIQEIVQQCVDIGKELNIPALASWDLRFLENGLLSGQEQKNNCHIIEPSVCRFNAVIAGIDIQGSILLIDFTNTCVVNLTIDFIDIDLTTYSMDSDNVDIITCLRVARFLQKRIQASLGKKLIITIIEDDFTTRLDDLAHYISYKLQSKVIAQGLIFNCPIFEIDNFSNDGDTIWLCFENKKSLKLPSSRAIYFEITLKLVYYRVKLIWLHNRFRSDKNTALQIYQKFKVKKVELSRENFSALEENYFDFTTTLVSLESYYYTMIIANKNHNSWLKQLQLCATENENNDFIFLERFEEEFHNYSEENQGILNYLKSAQYGFHQMLITINSIHNKKDREEQQIREEWRDRRRRERDRNLQLTLVAASFGVGTSGVTAAFSSSQANKENAIPFFSALPNSFMATAILSIALGLSIAVVTAIFIRLWQNYSDTREANTTFRLRLKKFPRLILKLVKRGK